MQGLQLVLRDMSHPSDKDSRRQLSHHNTGNLTFDLIENVLCFIVILFLEQFKPLERSQGPVVS